MYCSGTVYRYRTTSVGGEFFSLHLPVLFPDFIRYFVNETLIVPFSCYNNMLTNTEKTTGKLR
jgi:hypothetical protein